MKIGQFSKKHLSAVLDGLVRVKNGEIDNKEFGICWNSQHHCNGYDTYGVIADFSWGWGKHSGVQSYPVPYTGHHRASELKWTGEYGALRYELLDFLIDELTKAVGSCDE